MNRCLGHDSDMQLCATVRSGLCEVISVKRGSRYVIVFTIILVC